MRDRLLRDPGELRLLNLHEKKQREVQPTQGGPEYEEAHYDGLCSAGNGIQEEKNSYKINRTDWRGEKIPQRGVPGFAFVMSLEQTRNRVPVQEIRMTLITSHTREPKFSLTRPRYDIPQSAQHYLFWVHPARDHEECYWAIQSILHWVYEGKLEG